MGYESLCPTNIDRKFIMKSQVLNLSQEFPLHRFSWMQYSSKVDKVLKRSVDGMEFTTTLTSNGIFGYRTIKQATTGKQLIQILVRDSPEVAYCLDPVKFTNNILIHSVAVDSATAIERYHKFGTSDIDNAVKQFINGNSFDATVKLSGDGIEIIAKGDKLCIKGDNSGLGLTIAFGELINAVDQDAEMGSSSTYIVDGLTFEVTSLEDRIQVTRS